MSDDLRNIFAGLSAAALIIRGVPDDDVPQKAYDMADKLLEAKDQLPAGLPALKKKSINIRKRGNNEGAA